MRSPLIVLLLLASAAAGSRVAADEADQALPDAQAFAAAVLESRLDPETFDFEGAGYFKSDELAGKLWLSNVQAQLFGTGVSSDSCDPADRRRFDAVMWLMLLQQSADAAAWRASHDALLRGLAAHDSMVNDAAGKARAGTDARLTELARRVARDQAIRDLKRLEQMGEGMPANARQLWMPLLLGRMVDIDCDNTDWLAAQLREVGWFDIPRFGAGADNDAWLLVQHADRNPAFQREVLARLEKLPKGHTSPRNLAFLGDRVARSEGKPQRWGTQGTCQPDGTWQPHEIEDPEGVDARRKSLGLAPMAEHARVIAGQCPRMPVK